MLKVMLFFYTQIKKTIMNSGNYFTLTKHIVLVTSKSNKLNINYRYI